MKGTWGVAPVACLLVFGAISPSFASSPWRCTGAQRSVAAAPAQCPSAGGPAFRTGKRAPILQTAEGGVSGATECAGCRSWSTCLRGLGDLGASTQVVPLKNGIMYVYTAERPAEVRALQAVVVHHHERLRSLAPTAALCPACRVLHRASLRGRLSSEVLNIEGGCLMVTTSSDPAVVEKIYAEAGISGTPRVKG